MELLVRNRTKDYAVWRRVFDAQAGAGQAAGLTLRSLWRSADDPDEAFFVLAVEDRARAEAFMADPAAAEAGRESGVIDGDYWFVEPVAR